MYNETRRKLERIVRTGLPGKIPDDPAEGWKTRCAPTSSTPEKRWSSKISGRVRRSTSAAKLKPATTRTSAFRLKPAAACWARGADSASLPGHSTRTRCLVAGGGQPAGLRHRECAPVRGTRARHGASKPCGKSPPACAAPPIQMPLRARLFANWAGLGAADIHPAG